MANDTRLTACITEMAPLRHTPAGLPALDLVLSHSSRVVQEGQAREVRLDMPAVAVGTVAERLAGLTLGSQARFQGFLAARRGSRRAVLHVQDFQPEPLAGPPR